MSAWRLTTSAHLRRRSSSSSPRNDARSRNPRDAHAVLAREVCESGGNDLISSDHRAHQPRLACRRHQLFCGREAPPQGSFPDLRESWEFLRSQLTNLHADAEELSMQHGCHRAYVAVRQAQSYRGRRACLARHRKNCSRPIGGATRTYFREARRAATRMPLLPCSPGSWGWSQTAMDWAMHVRCRFRRRHDAASLARSCRNREDRGTARSRTTLSATLPRRALLMPVRP